MTGYVDDEILEYQGHWDAVQGQGEECRMDLAFLGEPRNWIRPTIERPTVEQVREVSRAFPNTHSGWS